MSGGSFDYVYSRDPEELVAGGHTDMLEQMCDELTALPFGQVAAVETRAVIDEIARLRGEMEKLRTRMMPIQRVWREVEWWRSNDGSEDATRAAVERFEGETQHIIVPDGAGDSPSALCTHCDKDFGWHCPDSPDNTCHYFTMEGKVRLISGQQIDPPPRHRPDHETEDQCIFCGNPQERK